MRILAVCIFSLAIAVAAHATDEAVDALKSRLDNAPAQDRPSLCVQIAQLQLRNADRFYTEGNIEQAMAAVLDIVTYSEKARDAAKESKKHLKHVEIAVRKMAEKLADIKRTLAFEDQPPVGKAIERLQDIRTSLLQEMFKKDKK
jgi:hypothetical protein